MQGQPRSRKQYHPQFSGQNDQVSQSLGRANAARDSARQAFKQMNMGITLANNTPAWEEVNEATSSAHGITSGFEIDGKDPGLADTTRISIDKHKVGRQVHQEFPGPGTEV